ncbi:MAG: cache domain-containing protein [Oscillospiraceae bacterium]|nr:cache domain-containing protein [Oscillospiraceae bacterium]MDY6207907.1 cache domain-containing protein [Oscillospiraceae bacterium]
MESIKKTFIIVVVTVILCMSCSTVFIYNKTKSLMRDAYENELRVESGMISGAIENSFLRPITVSETMSKDFIMNKILNINTKDEALSMEQEASEYLTSIRNGFGYSMVFAVNDASKAYYTCDGISKYLAPETNDQDIWYKVFMERDSELPYLLDVDIDAVNNWALSVFVNTAVYDDNGKYIGLCGVGVDMTELQRLLERYERIYDVKIDLINSEGLIQVDTDAANIENAYIEIDSPELYTDGECYYEVGENVNRTITYIDDLGWYLVVRNNTSLVSNVYSMLIPNVICMVVGVILIITIFSLSYGRIKNSLETK